jgi:methyl coenzyme M reductase alpha subunit
MTQSKNKQQLPGNSNETASVAEVIGATTEQATTEQATTEQAKPAYVPKFQIKKAEAAAAKHFEFKELGYREVTFEDMLQAQRISGENDGNGFKLAIMAQVCTFDGKQVTYEDLKALRWSDFLELQGMLGNSDWMGSQEQLSYSLGKLGLL